MILEIIEVFIEIFIIYFDFDFYKKGGGDAAECEARLHGAGYWGEYRGDDCASCSLGAPRYVHIYNHIYI